MLDGAIRTKQLMKRAKEYGMPAVAMTDHGNLFGAVEFFQECREGGRERSSAARCMSRPGLASKRRRRRARTRPWHFTLLAETDEGYRNLVKLVSAAHLEGFYYKPRVDKELLAKHSAGLIALSGCLKGEVNHWLTQGQPEKARETTATWRDIFGAENFFVELHDHGIEQQKRNNPELVKIAREFGLGLVAANDVHFLDRAHHEAHDVMICIGTGSMVHDEKRMHYSPELYFKSGDEMAALFAELPEACANTVRIAERVTMKMEFGKPKVSRLRAAGGQDAQRIPARSLLRRPAGAVWGTRGVGPEAAGSVSNTNSRSSRRPGSSATSSSSGTSPLREVAWHSRRTGARLGGGRAHRLRARDH